MFNAIQDRCNSFAQAWAWWVGMSILDAAVVLAVVSLVWLAIRRKASPQLGYLLFLLVPLKLFVPLHVTVPDRIFSWTPLMAVRGIGQDITPTAPPSAASALKNPINLPARSEYQASDNSSAQSTRSSTPLAQPSIAKRTIPSLSAWLMFAWLLGIFALLARLVHAQVRFHQTILRNANVVVPTLFSVDIGGLLERMHLGRNIRIVESDRVSSPVVWGIFRPTLILPSGIATSLSHKQLEWVLLHELAHVRRRDLAVNCFQRAAGILHFINPSIWIANRVINRLREYACDDIASVYSHISQVESGEAFLGVMRFAATVQHRPESNLEGALGMFESTVRASCFKRMMRLLDTNRQLSVKIRWGSLCLLLLTAALALPQIRAANPQSADESAKTTARVDEKTDEKTAMKVAEKKEEQKHDIAGQDSVEKKENAKNDEKSPFQFSVIIAKHVMLLDGKKIVSWPQIEEIIAKRPNPSQTIPHFYITRGATEAGLYESSKEEMMRLHGDYKLAGHSEGSLSPRADLRYDRIQTPQDLKPDESLRIEGDIVNSKGKPVAGAEIILVTPIDASIPYKTYDIYLVQGHIRNPLEEVMTYSNDKGQFAIYPPKNQSFFIITMHPEGGIGFSGKDQFARDHKIHLLDWAGLVSEFSKEPEKQDASLRTRIQQSSDLPEIVFTQYSSDLKNTQQTLLFGFTHVPPIFKTAISRNFPEKEGMSFGLSGASVDLLPGETRRLDLGPLTEQQRQYLERLRRDSDERRKKTATEQKELNSDGKNGSTSEASKAARDDGAEAAEDGKQRFELTIQGPDGKPVPEADVEFRGDTVPTAEQIQRGKFTRKSNYGVLVQADADGRLVFDLPKKPNRFEVHIEQPGYGPYWAEWSSENHPQPVPAKFVAELDAGWSVGGVIVDDQGKPIKGAEIHPSIKFKARPGDTHEIHVGTTLSTDAEGKWQFDSVPVAMKEVYVSIDHPDFKPERSALSRDKFGIGRDDRPTAKIEMQRGLTISGKVIDEAGKPISGVMIRTKFANDLRKAKTNDSGEYRLIGCEPKMTKIVVSAKGRATDKKEVLVAVDMEPVNFEMKPGGKVRIRVVDEKGNPVPNARIFFNHWRDSFYDYFEFDIIGQYTDANGVWQWNEAPLDEFQADICPPGGMQLLKQPFIARDEEYVVRTYPLLVITGSVVDAETKEPIKSFRVVPGARWSDSQIFWAREDSYLASDGRYRMQRDRGELAHLLHIEADGYKVAASREIKSDEGAVRLDFALTRVKDIEATVLTPDGKPAAGAKIALGIAGSQISITNGEFSRSTYAARLETDDAGRFRFPAQNAAYELVIMHPSGFACLKSPEQEIPSSLTLTPWARVEGTFRVGKQAMPNVSLEIMAHGIDSYGNDVPRIFTEHKATTGIDGRFIFDRVFPGEGRIGRAILLMVNDGATEVASSCRIAANFPAGKTTHIDLGGSGRPVIGKLEPAAGFSEKVLWNFATVDVQIYLPELKTPSMPPDIEKDPKQSKAWWDKWIKTEEGKLWQRSYDDAEKIRSARPFFWATVAPDGSFRIDDMLPGDYELSVRFSQHQAGHLSKYRFSVPSIDGNQASQPLDLGSLTLEKK